MLFRSSFLWLPVFVLFFSCEKVIDLVPEAQEPKLVVDGYIESGGQPVVVLSNSLNFFSRLTPAMLSGSFVRNARVSVSDGSRTVMLREYTVSFGPGNLYFYSTDTSTAAGRLTGVPGRQYTLSIETGGTAYEAITTIPLLSKKADSLWWQGAPNNPDTNRVVLFARVSDPPGKGNYIRYFTARNDSAYVPGLNSVFDDDIVDGVTYNIQVFRGQDRNQEFNNDEFGYFRRGDRVRLKLANIDRATYDFWRTWEQNQQNNGNPFGVPIKVLSNISNNALGIWAGYAIQELALTIPR